MLDDVLGWSKFIASIYINQGYEKGTLYLLQKLYKDYFNKSPRYLFVVLSCERVDWDRALYVSIMWNSKKGLKSRFSKYVDNDMSRVTQKRTLGQFWSKCFLSFFWMRILLRWICEIMNRIAVKISFLWGRKLYVYAAGSFAAIDTSWYLGNDMQTWTSVILYMNIKCISLGAFKMLILKSYTVPVCLHDVTHFLNQKAFSGKHVSIFYRENRTSFLNYVTATLRTLFAWRGSYDKMSH